MSSSSYRVDLWKAVHNGGTKFYHVARFNNDANSYSFALYHWGAVGADTGLESFAAGQLQLEPVVRGNGAGLAKISEKRDTRGYTEQVETKTHDFFSAAQVEAWCRSKMGTKAIRVVREAFRDPDFTANPTTATTAPAASASAQQLAQLLGQLPDAPTVQDLEMTFPQEPDETPDQKHEDWGSW
jgi:hypothetical protein